MLLDVCLNTLYFNYVMCVDVVFTACCAQSQGFSFQTFKTKEQKVPLPRLSIFPVTYRSIEGTNNITEQADADLMPKQCSHSLNQQ